MKERLRSLLMLAEERQMYVVIVAQEREFNTDTTSDVIMPFVASALSPSVVGWLNPACNYICQTYSRQRTEVKDVTIAGKTRQVATKSKHVEFCLRVAPDPTYTTKFRLPKGAVLPDAIVDPSFEKVQAIIRQ